MFVRAGDTNLDEIPRVQFPRALDNHPAVDLRGIGSAPGNDLMLGYLVDQDQPRI